MARNKYPEETLKLIIDVALRLFMEKGYDNTSIQDIINHLGGLSKGAIYHHFKSKEEIFEAICNKIDVECTAFYSKIRDDKTKSGLEKLRTMLESACENPSNDAVASMSYKLLRDPKFIVSQLKENFERTIPEFVQPIIEEGVRDGSLQTEYPKELAGMIVTLINVWINPIFTETNEKEMRRKLLFFQDIMKKLDVDIISDKLIEGYVELGKKYMQQEIE